MKKTKSYSKKLISIFLTVVMMLNILPYNVITTEASTTPTVYSQLNDYTAYNYPGGTGSTYASSGCGVYALVNAVKYLTGKKIDPHKLGKFAINCGARVNGGTNGQLLCQKAAKSADFGGKYGFKVSESYRFGSPKRTMKCTIGSTKTSSGYPSENEWNTLYNKLIAHLKNGEVAVVLVLGHYMAIVDYDASTGKFLILDSAAYTAKRLTANKGKYQWVTANQLNYNKASKANSKYNNQGPYIHLRSEITFFSKTGTSYKVTVNDATNVKNTSATINASLNTTAYVQKWGYYISTNASEVSKVDGTDGDTHVDTKTMDYCRVVNYDSNPQSMNKFSKNITKILGNELKPNTKYTYKVVVKISGRWIQSSTKSFTTAKNKPGAVTLNMSSSYSDIGVEDTATVSWKSTSDTDSYTLKLYNNNNKEVYSKEGIGGTTYTLPSSCFKSVGTYYAKIFSVNSAGTTEGKNQQEITVNKNVIVTFIDSITNETIETKDVVYGHDAVAPQNPSQTGYTFKGWDSSFKKVKEDIEVKTVYEKNTYTVKFIDGLTGDLIGKTQKVKYQESATAPEVQDTDGYVFTGWDVDFSSIEGDLTVTANYQWYNVNYPVVTNIVSVSRNSSKNGYDVVVKVENGTNDIVQGRNVIALKSESGYLLTKTESSAFSLNEKEVKNITIFVPYEDLAYKLEVYTINDYEKAGPIATPISKEIDNSSNWSPWIEYTGTVPKTVGIDGVSVIETKSETTPDVTQYSYRTKSTTTSYSTSLSGYTQNGYSLVKNTSGTIDYVSSWPSGFKTSNSLYSTYNKTPKSASETSTAKTVIDSTSTKGYIYWHWCRGVNAGTINRAIGWSKTSTFDTFHAFYSTTKKSYDKDANAYKYSSSSNCTDTYWWNGLKTKADGLVTVKTQKYTTYKKLYNYYKWSAWSDWSETAQTASSTKEVKTQTIKGTTTKYYRYKTSTPPSEPEVSNEQIVDIKGKVDTKYAGKEASIYIYKYTQTADYTNEYMGTITIPNDGVISIKNAKLREAPSVTTGDFTIVASIEGNITTTEIGRIEAPKPQYTVTYYDFDGKTIVYQETVTQGDTVKAPTSDVLNTPEGYRFTQWSQSTVNVQDNLEVMPMSEKEKYVVVFVDWGNKDVVMQEYEYGDEIVPPVAETAEGMIVTWDMSEVAIADEEMSDGTILTKYIATKNIVIETAYEEEVYENVFLSPESSLVEPGDGEDLNIDLSEIAKEDILITDETVYEENVDVPVEIEESPDYIFYGWKNIETGEYLVDSETNEDGVYYPVYEYAKTVEVPEADVITGEYNSFQIITLTCATEDAVIYYTTDGSDPAKSDTAIEYTGPITLTKSCTLKAYASAMGMNDSGTISELYAINTSTSGAAYHIVTVYSDLPQQEGYYYQALLKENTMFDDTTLKTDEGYTYAGLFIDELYSEEFDVNSEVITESMTLYANYIPKTYTVQFVDTEGNIISEQSINYGEAAVEPTAPEIEGYVFVGWDNDEYECVTEDIVCTASYVLESEYATVSLNKSKVTMMEGMDYTKLKATISPIELSDTEVEWTSSDWSVVSVDNEGIVTAEAPGVATITVTVISTGEIAECVFKVVGNYQTSIVLSENSELGIDSEGYIREIKEENNTVEYILSQFNNEVETMKIYDKEGNELTNEDLVGTGSVIKLISDGEVLDTMTVVMTGDIDGDGHVGNIDVSKISKWLIQTEELTYEQQLASDVNGDGYVNNKDASVVSRYLVGKETL